MSMQHIEHTVDVVVDEPLPDALLTATVSGPNQGQSEHRVRVTEQQYQELTDGTVPVEDLVYQSFIFLLERESKESILPSFDLVEIGKYFPEYPVTIKKMTSHR